jgi:hypothetical protein
MPTRGLRPLLLAHMNALHLVITHVLFRQFTQHGEAYVRHGEPPWR